MDKFSNIDKILKTPNDSNIAYNGKYLQVINYKNWEILKEKDKIIILPFFKDEGFILLRHEYIPTYQFGYTNTYLKNTSNFITVISGTLSENESPKSALKRELYEEAGILLSDFLEINIQDTFFQSKASVSKYHICLLDLSYNDYQQVKAPGDGSLPEKLSTTVKVSIGELDNIKTHDLITDYMILKLKKEYSL
jgi:8-oxo-dGTP pyrophosphatase MutT (NUDIX family)